MGNYMTMVAAQDAAALEEVKKEVTTTLPAKVPELLSGAQALMEALIAEGTEVIFGYPGVLLCLRMMLFSIIWTVLTIFWYVTNKGLVTPHRAMPAQAESLVYVWLLRGQVVPIW